MKNPFKKLSAPKAPSDKLPMGLPTGRKTDAMLLLLGLVVFTVLELLIVNKVIGSFWKLNIMLICINVILSASLNLINGYTGQF